MSIKIAFMRHGRTDWNRMHRIQGRTDIPLDPEGRAEMAAMRLPKDWQNADLWSSPLTRARETAQLVGTDPNIDTALIEMNWGDWEGLHGKDLLADPDSGYKDLDEWGWDYTPPNGESPRDVGARLFPFLDSLQKDAVIVTHIGIMRVALARAWGWPFSGPCPFSIKRGRLYVIEDNRAWSDPIRLDKLS
ncbi:MAG: histidine phosphatase family protein [Paracoccaceae bacterium]